MAVDYVQIFLKFLVFQNLKWFVNSKKPEFPTPIYKAPQLLFVRLIQHNLSLYIPS